MQFVLYTSETNDFAWDNGPFFNQHASILPFGKNLIGNIRRAIMRYCNNGNDKYFAK